MKTLPERFEKKGFTFQLDYREGNVAVYKRWKNPDNPHWEVVVIQEQKARSMQTPSGTIDLPHTELYPSSELWGTYGFTFRQYEAARAKAQSLVEGTPFLQV